MIDTAQLRQKEILEADKPLEEPAIDPTDALVALITGGGSIAAKSLGKAAKGAGQLGAKAVGSTITRTGGKLAGMSPAEAAAYQAAPKTVEALAAAKPLRKQKVAETALKTGAQKIGKRIDASAQARKAALEGKTIPESDIRNVQQFIGKSGPAPVGDVYGNVPAESVDTARGFIGGKQTTWKLDPETGALTKSTDPAAGSAYGEAKQALIKAAPEVEDELARAASLYEAKSGMSAGANRPINFMQSPSKDTQAAHEAADVLTDSTRMRRTGEQFRAANQLAKQPKSLTDIITKEVGKAALRAGSGTEKLIRGTGEAVEGAMMSKPIQAISKYKETGMGADALESFLSPKKATEVPTEWSPEEEAEYQAYLRSQGQ
jgi:hypothetical protein